MSNRDDFFQAMPSVARKWFAHAVAGMISADGVVTKDELDYLEKVFQFLERREHIDNLIEMVKKRELPELYQLRDINRKMAHRLMMALARTAISDLKFTKGEAAYLKYACGKLGFNKFICDHLLTWAMDHIALKEREEKIKKLAISMHSEYV